MNEIELIDDVGDFVPYAKKHLAESRGKRQENVTLDDLWPQPDWNIIVQLGMPVKVAAMVAMIRDGLATKPRTASQSVSNEEWRIAYDIAVPLIRDLLMASQTVEEAKDINNRLAHALGFDLKTRSSNISDHVEFWAAGRGTTRFRAPGNKTLRQAMLSHWLPKMGWPASDLTYKTTIVPIEFKGPVWRIGRIEGKHVHYLNKATFQCEADAIRVCLEESAKIVAGSAVPRKTGDARDVERIGPDHTGGVDITPERLMTEFGLRAIQFGNSVPQSERSAWITDTFNALADLAEIIKFPRASIGLGGLAVAFGARGEVGAVAHFETDLTVINLTRKNGAGALAHEWSHAIDNHLGRTIAKQDFLSVHFNELDDSHPVYGEISDLMHQTMLSILDESAFFEAAYEIAQVKRAGKYWYEREELFARAFEAYIQDALLKVGRTSPILVHGTLESDYDLDIVAACPYPTDAERTALGFYMEDLMRAVAKLPVGAAKEIF